jgi:hypothetical protein
MENQRSRRVTWEEVSAWGSGTGLSEGRSGPTFVNREVKVPGSRDQGIDVSPGPCFGQPYIEG